MVLPIDHTPTRSGARRTVITILAISAISQPSLNHLSTISHPSLTHLSPVSHPSLTRLSISQPSLNHLSPISHPSLTRLSTISQPSRTHLSPISQPSLDNLAPVSQPSGGGRVADAGEAVLVQWRSRLRWLVYETLGALRTAELFDIIVDYPDSTPAVDDLQHCLQNTNHHAQVRSPLPNPLQIVILLPC
eukprot:216135-Prorocentrum_minimum.AAC.1